MSVLPTILFRSPFEMGAIATTTESSDFPHTWSLPTNFAEVIQIES